MAQLVSLLGGYLSSAYGAGSVIGGLGRQIAGETGLQSTWGQVGQALGELSQRTSPVSIPPTSPLPSPPIVTYSPPRRNFTFSLGSRRGRRQGGEFDITSFLSNIGSI